MLFFSTHPLIYLQNPYNIICLPMGGSFINVCKVLGDPDAYLTEQNIYVPYRYEHQVLKKASLQLSSQPIYLFYSNMYCDFYYETI